MGPGVRATGGEAHRDGARRGDVSSSAPRLIRVLPSTRPTQHQLLQNDGMYSMFRRTSPPKASRPRAWRRTAVHRSSRRCRSRTSGGYYCRMPSPTPGCYLRPDPSVEDIATNWDVIRIRVAAQRTRRRSDGVGCEGVFHSPSSTCGAATDSGILTPRGRAPPAETEFQQASTRTSSAGIPFRGRMSRRRTCYPSPRARDAATDARSR